MSVLGRGYICWQICQLDVSSNVQLPFWTTRCQYCGGPSAKVGSSAKFGVAVLKASIFNSLGGPSAKVGLSANFGVLVYWHSKHIFSIDWGDSLAKVGSCAKFGAVVFKVSILNSLWGPPAKVVLSANFGVLVFKASLLYSQEGSICQDQL